MGGGTTEKRRMFEAELRRKEQKWEEEMSKREEHLKKILEHKEEIQERKGGGRSRSTEEVEAQS